MSLAALAPFPAEFESRVSARVPNPAAVLCHRDPSLRYCVYSRILQAILRENRALVRRYTAELGAAPTPSQAVPPPSAGVYDWASDCVPAPWPSPDVSTLSSAPADVGAPPPEAAAEVAVPEGPSPSRSDSDSDGSSSDEEWVLEDRAYVAERGAARAGQHKMARCATKWVRARSSRGHPAPSLHSTVVISVAVVGRLAKRVYAAFTPMKQVPAIPTSSWWTPVRKNYAVRG